jgi:hypothetical protein
VTALLLLLGLLPFTAVSGNLRARCRGALIEAWPEHASSGWFMYVPNMKHPVVTGGARATICGTESRRRVVIPLMAGSAIGVSAVAMSLRSRRTGPLE